ncbi:hypothetical protein ACRE_037910 [Hapsidospora chrysogenum ATCC 11550]|uniref:Uncharacterized protein n=1 Tax=Hapsidospora chrysogenum (strain ATCC 11550 / CBS 779.69 / DSM 880 / IAM 14645 / JCM 23072 / IMI 49137) TaxID=857340 RepID=A0A086T7N3_HAPC1|nr:hypothetical protein ACRE_037910 [Hapsidospora chrysogenum ATCC 11550]
MAARTRDDGDSRFMPCRQAIPFCMLDRVESDSSDNHAGSAVQPSSTEYMYMYMRDVLRAENPSLANGPSSGRGH